MLYGCSKWFQQPEKKTERNLRDYHVLILPQKIILKKKMKHSHFKTDIIFQTSIFWGFYISVFGRSAIRRSKRQGVKISEGRIVFTFVVLMSPYFWFNPDDSGKWHGSVPAPKSPEKKGSSSGKIIIWHFPEFRIQNCVSSLLSYCICSVCCMLLCISYVGWDKGWYLISMCGAQ